jgi:RNA polymerase sigma-70 factor (ECF subfamily)
MPPTAAAETRPAADHESALVGAARAGDRAALAFGAWLAAMARNAAASLHRRRPAAPLDDALADRAPRPPESAEAHEALAAIRSLPEAYSETLTLRLVEGLTGPEIALRTGMTEGSVRVNLHRGMKLLRARLGGER